MRAARLLERLQGVHDRGDRRWLARCPAHDDRRASLSVRELCDGRVLVHCFAGCDVEAVLDAVELAFRDLFPERTAIPHHVPEFRPFDPMTVLHAVAHEVAVVALISEDLRRGKEADLGRLLAAVQRIHRALDAVGEPRIPDELHRLRRGEST